MTLNKLLVIFVLATSCLCSQSCKKEKILPNSPLRVHEIEKLEQGVLYKFKYSSDGLSEIISQREINDNVLYDTIRVNYENRIITSVENILGSGTASMMRQGDTFIIEHIDPMNADEKVEFVMNDKQIIQFNWYLRWDQSTGYLLARSWKITNVNQNPSWIARITGNGIGVNKDTLTTMSYTDTRNPFYSLSPQERAVLVAWSGWGWSSLLYLPKNNLVQYTDNVEHVTNLEYVYNQNDWPIEIKKTGINGASSTLFYRYD